MTAPAPSIPGGFAKSYRKELRSDIWLMPPIYHRVWYLLRLKCNHEANCIPTARVFGIWILPGQRLTSIQQVAEGVSWYESGRQIIPDKRTIVRVLDWLEGNEMITVASNAQGTLISIVNWYSYNGDEPLQVTGDVLPMQRTMYTIENDKEVKTLKTSCASSKPKRSPRPPSGDQQTFLAWWSFAYVQVMGKPYMITGKDAKTAADLLKVHSLKPLVVMAAYFLTCSDEWLGAKRDLPMFRSMINRIPGHKDPAHDADTYRAAGIIPPDGVLFENWRFWEQDATREAA